MYEVAIIGAASAGASAGLFTAKAGKKTLLVDNDKSGTKIAWIENHYGVPEITGSNLLETGKKQAQKFGATVVNAKVLDLEKIENGFVVKTDQGQYEAEQVILATGKIVKLAKNLSLQMTQETESGIKSAIKVNKQGKTSVEGIWATGVVAGSSSHTIVTAGDGARVAINLISELNGKRYVDHDVLE